MPDPTRPGQEQPPVLVEPVRRADVDSLVEPMTRMLGELVDADAALGWTAPPSASEIDRLLRDLTCTTSDDAAAVVARSAEQVVGFGYWRRYSRPTHRPHADLEKLAVSADRPRRGIGRSLLAALVDRARRAGIEQLTLDFRGDNHRAEQLYLSYGFREYGRLTDFVAPTPDRRLDMVLHVLDLREGGQPESPSR